ncbi:acyl-CoA synthetase [Mycobacterium kansasii]|uniref:Fatty-acid--CoA ligase fadD25 n=1 Tax=Mycobacterium attenuatum TaxID=2341086 RepID=A0A498PZ86_9MYCO|nr:AMP-binding protein [Mycobacterium attenuatum]ORB86883.1 acyl-CoA synthetase [Mycobacterium kansasii]VBA38341.1 Putative fatty-acid--CoA ligase fadD25 [Mycobacterium attenuatum]VBA52248.1 Putative fatty-acid--CoA ligase fadD25 [Mycobacterium attenuatum]VBA57522.1 Putative fatty-acid--CoA ligase fadD25 [Mycobacterium attenuatum]
MVESSIPAVLRERASLQPNDTAMTFIDYEQDWEGVPETLTWAQLYRRMLNVGRQLRELGSPGDRAVILAPQSLDYVFGFLGALEAGLTAVPLSVPYSGVHDERTTSVLADTSPAVILTSSAVVNHVSGYGKPQGGQPAPALVEVDLLDLDARQGSSARPGSRNIEAPEALYLQYTSGSTRTPAGVVISNKNLFVNFGQIMDGYYGKYGKVPPPGAAVVSWLPFYHDMGFFVGIIIPILSGMPVVLTSPAGFLQRPARWMQLMASNGRVFTAAPNFAFDVAARKTTDKDLEGFDLGEVLHILNGSERVQPVTVKRFTDRFAKFNLDPAAVRPSYGMAEATVYIATREPGEPPKVVHFDSAKLPAGQAEPCEPGTGTGLVSYGIPRQMMVRIVDPDTGVECPTGSVGEIWLYGPNVGAGYWQKPAESERTFGARIVNPSENTPEGPWLRTGDSGFFFGEELFIIGRIKDLLIVYGRNHSPDDIEATIQEVTPGRCAAIAVPDQGAEKLVAIIELKKRPDADEDLADMQVVKREVTSAISKSHGLSVADLVLVSPGSIPITTSGKIRRAQCVELYRQDEFTRLDT